MSYRIDGVELYVRETLPGRMAFSLGQQGRSAEAAQRTRNPLGHVRVILRNSRGDKTFGCSADRLSVRWLDKRPGRSQARKRRDLVALIHAARDIYLDTPEFDSPFGHWLDCHRRIMKAGRDAGQEDLTSSFASALLERAVLDAVCRLHGQPIFQMLKQDRLGLRPQHVHPELAGISFSQVLPSVPRTEIYIRHTVGLADPLTDADLPDEKRIDDGLPETLEGYIAVDGVRHFKVKISGEPARDIDRLARIWQVVLAAEQPVVTLDANEAYGDLEAFAGFVKRFEKEMLGMFQHVEYIEQPLPRGLPVNAESEKWIRKIAERKPLIIDEGDGTLDAFKLAHSRGYQGTSHKNCKGFFKSMLNYGLAVHFARQGDRAFLSAEDLQNLPVVPLHQDFVTVGILGLAHCERNGHHYNYGLSMLSPKDKQNVVRHHSDLYVKRGDEWFLRLDEGRVTCDSLQCPGFGVRDEPDWPSMANMQSWVEMRHPA